MKSLKNLEKKWCFRIGVILVFIASIMYNVCLLSDIKIKDTNITALTDTLTISRNKLNEEVKSKSLLIMNIKELKNSNSSLTNEIDKLSKKDKKNLVEINKLNFTIDMLKDKIEDLEQDGPIIVVNDSVNIYSYPLKRTDEFRDLQGIFKVESTRSPISSKFEFTSDKIYADLVINKKKVDNSLILSVSSSNPYVNVTNVEGSIIDLKAYNSYQKPKKFGLGIQLGYGFTLDKNIVKLAPYAGVGLSYNLFNF